MFEEVLNFKNKSESWAKPLILNDYDTSAIFFK